MSDKKSTTKIEKDSEVVTPKKSYFFPKYGKSVKAESLAEAVVKVKSKKETK
tara:strand:- start:221 stop:376 length:156 start_codon:yes stop_codon:yes gene_type:complete